MSKRNAIIVMLVVILLIGGGLLFFYSHSAQKQTTSSPTVSTANPFGAEPANVSPNNSEGGANTANTGSVQTNTANANLAALIELYANPISGSHFAASGTSDVLAFADRGDGNIYQYVPGTQSAEPARLTDTTVPKAQELVWSPSSEKFVYRYLDNDTDTIDSFSGAITSASSSGDLASVVGNFLNQNIAELVASPNTDKIFSVFEKSGGTGSEGVLSNFDGTGQKNIFDSPVSFWNISWPASSIIAFTTKPTYEDYGDLFFFNTSDNSFQKILGGMTGFSTLTNTKTTLVAYSQSENSAFSLGVYDVKNKTDKHISIATLADKCVWGIKDPDTLYCAVPQTIPPDNYPDAWYQGTESFSDTIWMIDADSGISTELYAPSSNENLDAMDLSISPDDTYLAFTNKNDLSLWLLNMNSPKS